jgi:hypothetical protein
MPRSRRPASGAGERRPRRSPSEIRRPAMRSRSPLRTTPMRSTSITTPTPTRRNRSPRRAHVGAHAVPPPKGPSRGFSSIRCRFGRGPTVVGSKHLYRCEQRQSSPRRRSRPQAAQRLRAWRSTRSEFRASQTIIAPTPTPLTRTRSTNAWALSVTMRGSAVGAPPVSKQLSDRGERVELCLETVELEQRRLYERDLLRLFQRPADLIADLEGGDDRPGKALSRRGLCSRCGEFDRSLAVLRRHYTLSVHGPPARSHRTGERSQRRPRLLRPRPPTGARRLST